MVRTPFVSVIMPVRNEAKSIGQTLDSLLSQAYPEDSFEILVADGRSDDATREIVSEYAGRHKNIRLFDNPKRWSSAARNVGVQNAVGDYVIIVDGHCELADPEYLAKLADAFERTGADCLGRPQPLDVSNGTFVQKAIAAARSSRLGHHPDSFIYSQGEQFVPAHSVAVAYRRSLFDEVGLFDEAFDACEDVELNHRIDKAGRRCLFTDRITLPYEPRNSLSGLARQMIRYGRGRVRLMRKHPETFSLKSLLPGCFVLGLLLGPLTFLFSSLLASVYVGTVLLYLTLVLLFSIQAARKEASWPLLAYLPLVFMTIHLSAGWGILLECLRVGGRSRA